MINKYYDQDCNLGMLDGKTVAIIGFGSQGHAHAMNLKESGVDVVVGLRPGSQHVAKAEAAGLKVLGIEEAAEAGNVVMMLVPDEYKNQIAKHMKEGDTLMFAHGFNIHYSQIQPADYLDVSMVAPKGPGHIVRSLYTQGSGVPCLIAVEQDKSGKIKKGDVSISGNTDLIDALKKRTNYDITLYFNGMRLVTTLRSDTGAPANGTPADSAVYEKIMKGKTVFLSNVKLYGKEYYVLYQPLVNADGTVAGGIGVAKDATDVQKTIAAQTRRITLISIVLLVLAAVVIIFLTTRMVTVMKSTKHFLAKLAQGEFGVVPKQKHVKRNDELGDIYRSSVQLQQELRKIVDNIKQSSESLINSANQLTGMAQSTRTTVDSVCDSMRGITDASVTQNEETTVAIGNVQGMANEIAYISHIMDSLTQHANQMSEAEQASEAIIHQLNASNEETIDTITNVAEQINALHSSVESIQTAINMIQSIAEETDLLSLNANIEAARAGESGRGFSVVATQISKLADQSNSTAENVADIIANIIAEADRMVEMMGDVKNKIHEQQKKLDDTMDKSGAVALGVNNSLRDIDTIRNKISVLSQSGDSIQDIVTNLASIAEQNESSTQATMDSALGMSDTMNSLENASESLKDMARALDESLVRFKM